MQEDEEWSCQSCTYLNTISATRCEMCHAHPPRKQQQSRHNHSGISKSRTITGRNTIDLTSAVDEGEVKVMASTESARRKRKRERPKEGIRNVNLITISDDVGEKDHMMSKALDRSAEDTYENCSTGRRQGLNKRDESSDYRLESSLRDDQLKEKANERHSKMKLSNTLVQSSLFGTIVRSKKENVDKGSLTTASSSSSTKKTSKTNTVKPMKRQKPTGHETTFQIPIPSTASNDLSSSTILPQDPFQRYQHLYQKALKTLKHTFRINSLRNLQPQAIQSALQNKSQIIIMATGGGKSLCYQLPAAVLPGVTIVVSPLIALMVDQVRSLREKGVEAACICSANSHKENKDILQRLKTGGRGNTSTDNNGGAATSKSNKHKSSVGTKPIKLLYCTPELIQTPRFRTVLTELHSKNHLSLIAIDEAHCLSTWGHDFRPSYRQLSWIRQSFPTLPCMACTATATAKVISDMRQVLGFGSDVECHLSTFNRPNVHYEVRYKDTMSEDVAMKNLIQVILKEHENCRRDNRPCSGIIYVHKRNDTELLTLKIQEAGITAAPYHGGLKDAQRKEIQDKWTIGEVQVAVATVAFGMGIDLAHVRYVLHWSLPKSVEGFYQESGRGGRDGSTAKSIVYYSKDDASKFKYLIKKQAEAKAAKENREPRGDNAKLTALYEMVDYCTTGGCRRQYLLKHFGELIEPGKICKKTCDYCINPKKTEGAINGSVTSSSRSRAVRDVKNQMRKFKIGAAFSREEYNGNEGEYDQRHSNFVNESGLGITQLGSAFDSTSDYKGSRSSKDILSHYETKECGETKGFVTFKAKGRKALENAMTDKANNESVPKSIPMPAHLLAKISNLHSQASSPSKCSNRVQSSTEISSEADKLRAELASLKDQKKQLIKNTVFKSSTSAASKPPPPPVLSIKSHRRRINHKSKKSRRK